ncbi:hypothetical protein EIP91_007687 [Steccherinum ochraceum]|uniref:Uncharacterized protein n=1 Tax=Steccherinum ochraceum TaxID=92696 RepID=A0A4V2MVH5_9APHY|nr:hypothetical protein EIP91_007687 [Steccherinum ochraceum]
MGAHDLRVLELRPVEDLLAANAQMFPAVTSLRNLKSIDMDGLYCQTNQAVELLQQITSDLVSATLHPYDYRFDSAEPEGAPDILTMLSKFRQSLTQIRISYPLRELNGFGHGIIFPQVRKLSVEAGFWIRPSLGALAYAFPGLNQLVWHYDPPAPNEMEESREENSSEHYQSWLHCDSLSCSARWGYALCLRSPVRYWNCRYLSAEKEFPDYFLTALSEIRPENLRLNLHLEASQASLEHITNLFPPVGIAHLDVTISSRLFFNGMRSGEFYGKVLMMLGKGISSLAQLRSLALHVCVDVNEFHTEHKGLDLAKINAIALGRRLAHHAPQLTHASFKLSRETRISELETELEEYMRFSRDKSVGNIVHERLTLQAGRELLKSSLLVAMEF